MSNKNKYEVGCVDDDTNDIRLPGSVQPEPKRGNYAYGAENANPAKPTPLDTMNTAGVIGQPHIGGDYVPTPQKTASVTGPTGLVETWASNENLSKKYTYPQTSQDIPSLDNPRTQGSNLT